MLGDLLQPVKTKLFDHRMADGSRNFADLPEICDWSDLRRHVGHLPGAKETRYLSDGITEMWLDFTFEGHSFSVNNQMGDFWFFVRDPSCPEAILKAVIEHCERLILPEDGGDDASS